MARAARPQGREASHTPLPVRRSHELPAPPVPGCVAYTQHTAESHTRREREIGERELVRSDSPSPKAKTRGRVLSNVANVKLVYLGAERLGCGGQQGPGARQCARQAAGQAGCSKRNATRRVRERRVEGHAHRHDGRVYKIDLCSGGRAHQQRCKSTARDAQIRQKVWPHGSVSGSSRMSKLEITYSKSYLALETSPPGRSE